MEEKIIERYNDLIKSGDIKALNDLGEFYIWIKQDEKGNKLLKEAADKERAKIAELKAKHEEAVAQLEALKQEKAREEQRQKEEQARKEQQQRELEDYNRAIDEVLYGTNATTNTTTSNKSKNTLPVTNTSNESIYIVIGAAILAVLAGLGLYFKKNNKKD